MDAQSLDAKTWFRPLPNPLPLPQFGHFDNESLIVQSRFRTEFLLIKKMIFFVGLWVGGDAEVNKFSSMQINLKQRAHVQT